MLTQTAKSLDIQILKLFGVKIQHQSFLNTFPLFIFADIYIYTYFCHCILKVCNLLNLTIQGLTIIIGLNLRRYFEFGLLNKNEIVRM